jgi:PAS domain S-box-containing protein
VPATPGSRAVLPRRYSLRWRLPLLVCVIITIVLAGFLLAAYRRVETTLVTAGGARARNAAGQVASLLQSSVARAVSEMSRVAEEPGLRRFLQNPTDRGREAARTSLSSLAQGSARRVTLWNVDGSRLLEMDVPANGSGSGSGAETPVPPGEPPSAAGLGPLEISNDLVVADVAVAIQRLPFSADSESSVPLGYLTLRSALSINPPGLMGRLVGPGATVSIGNRTGGDWTDLSRVVPAPPVDLTRDAVNEYVGSDGEPRLGALTAVGGTPWAVSVELQRASIVAPARSFLRSMVVFAAAFIAVAAILVSLLMARVTTPLYDLSQAAAEIAGGNYSQRVSVSRRDEVGRLSTAFNTMASRVDDAYGALQETNEHTQFALGAARIGVWEANLQNGQIKWSESMRFVQGVSPSAFDGTSAAFLALVHADDRDSMARHITGQTSPDVFDLSFRALWPDGSLHWIEGKGRIVRADTGEPTSVLAVSIDVTERRHLQAQLTQAQKMEAIGQLAGGVAHDFNNLLTAILGYGNLILEKLDDPSLRSDVLEILRAGESAAALTRQLLAFSSRQVMQPSLVSLNEVVASIEKMLRRLIGENIDVVVTPHSVVDAVQVDSAQVEQVIVNLAVNARDAMPDGGRLTIETSMVDLDDAYCREHASVTPGRHVVLSVSDTGSGMDPETQARLFEPFFTTKTQGKGTGLGLATVYGIVKQSGGHIYVYSELGRGTTFKLYLPSVGEASGKAATKRTPTEVTGGDETILVVEDDEAARSLASRVLKRLGYRVLVADGGEEALRLLEVKTNRVHLLVSDVIMPSMTGPELADRIAIAHPEAKVLFTSGYSDDAIVRHGVLSPGALFMQKPYTPAVLARKVREALSPSSASVPAAD